MLQSCHTLLSCHALLSQVSCVSLLVVTLSAFLLLLPGGLWSSCFASGIPYGLLLLFAERVCPYFGFTKHHQEHIFGVFRSQSRPQNSAFVVNHALRTFVYVQRHLHKLNQHRQIWLTFPQPRPPYFLRILCGLAIIPQHCLISPVSTTCDFSENQLPT